MSKNTKHLKVCCILAMVTGLVGAIVGVARVLGGNAGIVAALITITGLASLAFGAWAAIAANVPSNAGRIAGVSLAVFLICLGGSVACVVLSRNNNPDAVLYLGICPPLIVVALSRFFAVRARRELEQK